MNIRVLTPEVAAKIAAGEVVERPASIVKELIENAIDAGATRITVDLQGGGVALLRVSDNGQGVARADLPLVFARHATSKLASIDDLDQLRTLGFRGEALASVGAVAHVTFASRVAGAESGAQLAMNDGQPSEIIPMAMPQGTIVTVRDLFAQVPARLKFLKSRQGEAGYCVQIIERYALAYPEIQFVVTSEGRLATRTPGDGHLTSTIAQVYDLAAAEQMIPLSYGDTEADRALPLTERPPVVSGMTSRPAYYKSTRQHVFLYVNRRWVRNQMMQHAVEEAYHSLLLTGRHPVAVVHIELDPTLVDVNVHPAKTEVKFARERQVYAAIQRAVRAAVVDTTEAPEVSHQAFTVPGVNPGNSSAPLGRPITVSMPAPKGSTPPITPLPSPTPALWNEQDMHEASRARAESIPVAQPPAPKHLPALRVLGQVSQSYIITEGPDGVYLIDQHAAHERILLEKMVAQWRRQDMPSQALLEPIVVDLTPDVFTEVEERIADVEKLGFTLEAFGVTAFLVRAVPGTLAGHATPEALADLLPDLVGGDHAGHAETWEEHALANIACRAAIKAGKVLTPDEQRELVRQLETADARHSCCHGRPTTVHLSLDALEREFARR